VVPFLAMTAERFTFRTAYWDDRTARAEFKRFLVEIHGLDLTLWERTGYWDHELYQPFSLFDGDRIVSHLCLYSMDLVVDGRPCRVGQFSGVGTAETHRRQGLNRWLTEHALRWAAPTHEGFFLFSAEGAVDYYRSCGFSPVVESVHSLQVDAPAERPGLVRMDPESPRDRDLVFRAASERCPVSNVLGALNPRLLMFHWLYDLRDHAYWIADLGVVVFASSDGQRLTLYDVVGAYVPPFAELHPYLAGMVHEEVEFLFTVDRMGIEPSSTRRLDASFMHVMAPFGLPRGGANVPYTSHA